MYKKFILDKTKQIKNALIQRKISSLKKVQYECIEHMAVEFNQNIFNLAIICYMLSKMIAKPRYWKTKGLNVYSKKIEKSLDTILNLNYEEGNISKILQEIIETVHSLDIQDKKYIHELIEGGKIKIGSSLYSKGITLGVASDLSGAERIDIMEYIGKTTIHENNREPVEINDRIKKVREIFG
ncbi:MAG: hypothetical protein WC356_01270 [Candidatus Micrarchaeia archaeon]|jgi:hypothetical protein